MLVTVMLCDCCSVDCCSVDCCVALLLPVILMTVVILYCAGCGVIGCCVAVPWCCHAVALMCHCVVAFLVRTTKGISKMLTKDTNFFSIRMTEMISYRL